LAIAPQSQTLDCCGDASFEAEEGDRLPLVLRLLALAPFTLSVALDSPLSALNA
jgi:hypothetical protein